jgi:hypothetical protein
LPADGVAPFNLLYIFDQEAIRSPEEKKKTTDPKEPG